MPNMRHCGSASALCHGTLKRTPLLSSRRVQLENLIARALVHARLAFRGLVGELHRRVRAWIIANSTIGAGACCTNGPLGMISLRVCSTQRDARELAGKVASALRFRRPFADCVTKYGGALLDTLAASDVRMVLHNHVRDLGLDAYAGMVSAETHRTSTAPQSSSSSQHECISCAGARLQDGGFFCQRGLSTVDVWSPAVLALADGSANSSKASGPGMVHARPGQMFLRPCWRWSLESRILQKCREGHAGDWNRHSAPPYCGAAQKGRPILGAGEAAHGLRRQRWRRVKGPLTAALATLCALRWHPKGPVLWADGSNSSSLQRVQPLIPDTSVMSTLLRLINSEQGQGLQYGVDWQGTGLHFSLSQKAWPAQGGELSHGLFDGGFVASAATARLPAHGRSPSRPDLFAV